MTRDYDFSDFERDLGIKERRGDAILGLAQQLEAMHPFKSTEDNGELFVYNNDKGVYENNGEVIIKGALQKYCPRITKSAISEVVEKIRQRNYMKRSEFDKDPNVVNLRNGLFNISTCLLTPHTAAYPSLIQLNVKYNPKATCKPIIEHLYNTFQDASDVPMFLEWIAYNLFWKNKDLQKEMLLVGEPGCGKSKLLDVLIALIGTENVGAVTFQQLSTNRFAKAELFGKLANIYADISHVAVQDLENFKAIATADEITAEYKGMRLFKFRPVAKLTYSCNIPPKPPINVDDSFYRRWLLIKCAWKDNDFFTGKKRTKDANIFKKLATEENLSGLFNLAVLAAKRLERYGKFCKDVPTDQIREDYDQLSNSVVLWLNTCTKNDPQSTTPVELAYQNYVEFCKSTKRTPRRLEWFGRELTKQNIVRIQIGTERQWSYCLKLLTSIGSSVFSTRILENKTEGSILVSKTLDSHLNAGEALA